MRLCFAVVVLSAALAQAAAADPTLQPSMAVGDTHDCTRYYPVLSARLFESGDVLLQYDVDAGGMIGNVQLLQSSGAPRLDQAALDCVRTAWRNTPAQLNGVAVASPGHKATIRYLRDPPRTAEDFLGRGIVLNALGEHDRAIADYIQALVLRPDYPDALRDRAVAYQAIGRHDLALADVANMTRLTFSKAIGGSHDCAAFFSDEARRDNEQGAITLVYDLTETGAITNVVLVKSSGWPLLDGGALQCITQQWRSTPMLLDGKPFASAGHEVSIQFSMH